MSRPADLSAVLGAMTPKTADKSWTSAPCAGAETMLNLGATNAAA